MSDDYGTTVHQIGHEYEVDDNDVQRAVRHARRLPPPPAPR